MASLENIAILCLYVLIFCTLKSKQNGLSKLTDCIEGNQKSKGLILVSTLDGRLSALDFNGNFSWQIATHPGPLLSSNIHKLELTNNGQWIRIIPSLSGSLYKFDGITVDAIPISADSLLTSSFRYSDDLVIAGRRDVRTYGVGLHNGELLYECSAQGCMTKTKDKNQDIDVIVIERSTQIVRAIEPRTGSERWNFSVGQHDVKIPQAGYISLDLKQDDCNLTTVVPDGLLIASKEKFGEIMWKYKFETPIVSVWKWNGRKLVSINLFSIANPEHSTAVPFSPIIYIGMHNKQLYIHESVTMQQALQRKKHTGTEVADSQSLARIPWKPVPASEAALVALDEADDSTALSVLYSSEYVNGNGYYLYSAIDNEKRNMFLCDKNITLSADTSTADEEFSISIWYWWKEVFIISLTTAVLLNIMCQCSIFKNRDSKQEIISADHRVDVTPQILPRLNNRTLSESTNMHFFSTYMTEFEPVSCLGKGGFGVVFEVKKKFDECGYAIKRIILPNDPKSKDHVMREVKALAKLDHANIVRYFNAWEESPPDGWQKEHDLKWLNDTCTYESTATTANALEAFNLKKSMSVVIDVPDISTCMEALDLSIQTSDSFIIFGSPQHSQSGKLENGKEHTETSSMSDHLIKRLKWHKPNRRSYSLDITSKGSVALPTKPPTVFLYIQMQLCRKESLKEWLAANVNRDFASVLSIFKQILGAVEYIHLQGLIHRDLKPSNIFFSLEGQIKVGDFGLVTEIEGTMTSESSKSSSYVGRSRSKAVGTHLYMSPEQYECRSYNYKVDIYSLGIIFFELLVPFLTEMERCSTLTNLRKNIYPDDFHNNFGQEHQLLCIMLAKNPQERPTTIGIRARPPIGEDDVNTQHHFELPGLRRIETEYA